jgi:predicted DNA-binding protein (UPF0251 family)
MDEEGGDWLGNTDGNMDFKYLGKGKFMFACRVEIRSLIIVMFKWTNDDCRDMKFRLSRNALCNQCQPIEWVVQLVIPVLNTLITDQWKVHKTLIEWFSCKFANLPQNLTHETIFVIAFCMGRHFTVFWSLLTKDRHKCMLCMGRHFTVFWSLLTKDRHKCMLCMGRHFTVFWSLLTKDRQKCMLCMGRHFTVFWSLLTKDRQKCMLCMGRHFTVFWSLFTKDRQKCVLSMFMRAMKRRPTDCIQ